MMDVLQQLIVATDIQRDCVTMDIMLQHMFPTQLVLQDLSGGVLLGWLRAKYVPYL